MATLAHLGEHTFEEGQPASIWEVSFLAILSFLAAPPFWYPPGTRTHRTASRRQAENHAVTGISRWPGQDSNLRATDYESAALTN